MRGWSGTDSDIGKAVKKVSNETLAAYGEAPQFVEEHANLERAAIEGGYGRRQLFELVQNGADELIGSAGKVHVVLTDHALYCANQGKPLSAKGVGALLASHLSPKKGVEIGRFGLGFKSVLGITSKPEVLSRSGCIRFDPTAARERIEAVVGKVDRVPVLRIGTPVDPDDAVEGDLVLADLMSWATTVIKLPLDQPDSSWLPDDMKNFPDQFLLFSPHVEELILEDRTSDTTRHIRSVTEDEEIVLEEGNNRARWRVFSTEVEPTERARNDGGAMADRERIPLVWAVPTRRGRRGEFWAFFPTLDQTTLSGVVNAPWKLNEDRTRVIEGPFNEELLDAVKMLVTDHLEDLCPAEDPGVVLELMPARGREAAGWADGFLTKLFNDSAKYVATVPDQTGELEFPSSLNLHPEDIPRTVLDLWHSQPGHPDDWVHPSIETTARRARVEMYMEPKRASDVTAWLEALTSGRTVEGSVSAILVAAALIDAVPQLSDDARKARIVLTDDGELAAAEEAIFRRAPLPVDVDARYVEVKVANATGVDDALDGLGVPTVDAFRVLQAKLQEDVSRWEDADWEVFWDLVRQSSLSDVAGELQQRNLGATSIRVKNREGTFARLAALLLPGEIVGESEDDQAATVDTAYHRDELRLLRELGATGGPLADGGSIAEGFYATYLARAEKKYLKRLEGTGSSPNRDYLAFRRRKFAGPLTPLTTLSPRARVRYTTALLSIASDLSPWMYGHTSQSRYPEMQYPNPVVWMVRAAGILQTSLGPRVAKSAVGRGLSELADVLPVADCSAAAATALRLPDQLEQLSDDHWEECLARLAEADDDRVIGLGYGSAATAGRDAPDMMRCRVGSAHDMREPAEITVASDDELVRVLSQTGQPFIRLDDDVAERLVKAWGLQPAGSAVRTEVQHVPAGEDEFLTDVFPLLRLRLSDEQRTMRLVRCQELRVVRVTQAGKTSTAKDFVVDGERLFASSELDSTDLLRQVSQALGLGLADSDIDAVIRNLENQRVVKLRTSIRKASDNLDRLLLAVGAEALRSHVPTTLLSAVEAIEGDLDDRGLAQLAIVVHGVNVLKEHSATLEERGLTPPQRWAGGRRAIAFVRELGFPSEYAGFESRSLDRALEVEGPPQLGNLHGYQETVVEDIRSVLRGDDGLRGLLSLPTGAGKTRVTIEAIIESMLKGEVDSPVLWIAQTEELCEQAVQTWSELWRALGPAGRRLTISRLWSSFEADEAEHGDQVVVATIQKLAAGVFEKKGYAWLSKASCIIVDEAHTSIGPSYTAMLEWQGMGRGKDRAPLIGLTATPFRGTNEEEGKRLVSRYGARRLDLRALGGADAYPHLQNLGILSRVDHQVLEGSELEMSDEDLARLQKFQRLPEGPARRLGADVGRNETLMRSIQGLDGSWPVLLFAVSVEHAQTMAALLSREGIPAAAITGEMDRSIRRHYIEEFRRDGIRVLTNYGVLTAGFDAPKVRALYIARPTYAPNIYQQMIGRGLRGPLNGGTERCLLVNVEDNISRFEDKLAFHEFDYLWSNGASANGDSAS
jgi:superfamily II DNA or RNA helicase